MSQFNATSIVVDDDNPSVVYSPGWALLPETASPVYNKTLHAANTTGQWASFTFSGVRVDVYGASTLEGFQYDLSTYAIDGQVVGKYQPPTTLNSTTGLATSLLFFNSPTLAPGTHILNITVETAQASAGPFLLDYIVYTPGTSQQSSSPVSSPSQTLSSQSSPISVTAPTPSSAVISASSKAPVGAIVGGVVGGVAALLLVAGLLWYYLRRRRMIPASDHKLDIDPFPGNVPRHAGSGTLWLESGTRVNTESVPPPPTQLSEMSEISSLPEKSSFVKQRPSHARTETTETGSTQASGSTQDTGTRRTVLTIQHNDSGVRLPRSPPELPLELPPVYSPV
ncbi:hypothetical protein OBBRIDRAFT_239652 [Obba rivulosa]|uniref:Uncharacterized protein n=1 Tax=Obba rivulosa TaxID=1052685 RepID=A0A8E2J3N3_9APHY|nr:hypothetical protein OBBRIDRAFT_239652 [Obba rivulosa]